MKTINHYLRENYIKVVFKNHYKTKSLFFSATSQRVAPSVHASIPSKYQTFFTSFKEDLGFNSCSVRFPELSHCVDDNPGPASYVTYQTSTMTAPQESLSKVAGVFTYIIFYC